MSASGASLMMEVSCVSKWGQPHGGGVLCQQVGPASWWRCPVSASGASLMMEVSASGASLMMEVSCVSKWGQPHGGGVLCQQVGPASWWRCPVSASGASLMMEVSCVSKWGQPHDGGVLCQQVGLSAVLADTLHHFLPPSSSLCMCVRVHMSTCVYTCVCVVFLSLSRNLIIPLFLPAVPRTANKLPYCISPVVQVPAVALLCVCVHSVCVCVSVSVRERERERVLPPETESSSSPP